MKADFHSGKRSESVLSQGRVLLWRGASAPRVSAAAAAEEMSRRPQCFAKYVAYHESHALLRTETPRRCGVRSVGLGRYVVSDVGVVMLRGEHEQLRNPDPGPCHAHHQVVELGVALRGQADSLPLGT